MLIILRAHSVRVAVLRGRSGTVKAIEMIRSPEITKES